MFPPIRKRIARKERWKKPFHDKVASLQYNIARETLSIQSIVTN